MFRIEENGIIGTYASDTNDIRNTFFQCWCECLSRVGMTTIHHLSFLTVSLKQAVNIFFLVMETVVTIFKGYKLKDQQTARHTNGKSDDVNNGKALIADQVSIGDFKIVFIHT